MLADSRAPALEQTSDIRPPERKGRYIRTFTGRQYWPMDPRPEDICIEDVAHALSNLCRFTGHTRTYFSVAEHSVHVSFMVPAELAFVGLLHDAHEAYVNDIAKPFKVGLPGYITAEEQNWAALAQRFGLPRELPKAIKDADAGAFRYELSELMHSQPDDLGSTDPIPYLGRLGMMPNEAEAAFLKRFRELEPQ